METGLNVWDGGILLARYLESVTVPNMLGAGKQRLRCLELGAGTGVGGLAFAILGQEAIISDLASYSPSIQANIDRNAATITGAGGLARFAALDWNQPPDRGEFGDIDVVCGADVIWHTSFVGIYVQVL